MDMSTKAIWKHLASCGVSRRQKTDPSQPSDALRVFSWRKASSCTMCLAWVLQRSWNNLLTTALIVLGFVPRIQAFGHLVLAQQFSDLWPISLTWKMGSLKKSKSHVSLLRNFSSFVNKTLTVHDEYLKILSKFDHVPKHFMNQNQLIRDDLLT